VQEDGGLPYHIEQVLGLDLVNVEGIREKKYKVVVDAINSTGALAVPMLLEALNCEVIVLNGEITGRFAHNPEPLKDNLLQTCREVVNARANMGIVVDPDVDRLVFINEDGEMFGEEYTLVAVADYVLSKRQGAAVSNLSSSRALKDVCDKHEQPYYAAAVGEVNVVEKMKAVGAVIGGEGNGGIIFPELHYGRDALVGIGLFLSHAVEIGRNLSMIRRSYPDYRMVKSKIQQSPDLDFEEVKAALAEKYKKEQINTEDGLKIDFESGWVHLRPSNTEPIVRIYSESSSEVIASSFVRKIIDDIGNLTSK
jgi:phosphomannomutase